MDTVWLILCLLSVAFSIYLFRENRMLKKDCVTGLANGHMAKKWLGRRKIRSLSVALLYIDIDRFKGYNDQFGHKMGDMILNEVGKQLVTVCRSDDLVARIHGDEFLVGLSNVDEFSAGEVSDRIKLACSTIDAPLPVSVSIGIAIKGKATAMCPLEIIDRADSRMYDDKNTKKLV